jgi:hypothetical protein
MARICKGILREGLYRGNNGSFIGRFRGMRGLVRDRGACSRGNAGLRIDLHCGGKHNVYNDGKKDLFYGILFHI